MSAVLKSTKNSSSPGYLGFTYEFYKMFWCQFGPFIYKAIQLRDKLHDSQTIGIIALIPKSDKPKEYLDSWRPLPLLNSIYKIISGVLAKDSMAYCRKLFIKISVDLCHGDTLEIALELQMMSLNMLKEIT